VEFLIEYGMFLAKAVTIVLAVIAVIIAITVATVKPKANKGELHLDDISEEHRDMVTDLHAQLLDKKQFKLWQKHQPEVIKERARLFVIDFHGSVDAKETDALREEVTAVLAIARKQDAVLVRLESGGGVVHGYGLAASQLARIKLAGIPLTISVDKIAASGGYMMACIADKIIAAPFSIVGSIGVVAQLPNFHRLLKKNDIDFEQFTAGEFKRTVTLFAENTEQGKQKFQQELDHTHQLFKSFVAQYRPALELDKVATGEHWFGYQALELGLVDSLATSDEYLQSRFTDQQVLKVQYRLRKTLAERAGIAASSFVHHTYTRLRTWSLGNQ
jgi:serine protease SohB